YRGWLPRWLRSPRQRVAATWEPAASKPARINLQPANAASFARKRVVRRRRRQARANQRLIDTRLLVRTRSGGRAREPAGHLRDETGCAGCCCGNRPSVIAQAHLSK